MPELHTISKPPCIIVDLDGTLSDSEARKHLVQKPNRDWDKFYDLCDQDPIQRHIAVITNALSAHYAVVLVSGRVERVRAKTIAWLDKHWVRYDALFMRPDGDFRSDDILKEEILDRDIMPKWHPDFAFDDRDRVVAMWRRRGIPCLQVAPGDF